MENLESNKPTAVDLFSEEFERKFSEEGQVYLRKIEPIRGARQVDAPEIVETRLPDGTFESTQTAKSGDWVIVGSKGEQFVFTNQKFQNLYIQNEHGEWIPRERRIIAFKNPLGVAIRIQASWGTAENPAYQDGSEQAMLAAEIDGEGNMTNDRYIIGDEEMLLNNYIRDTRES